MDKTASPREPARRLVLTVPGEVFVALQEQARRELRPTKAEALRLLMAGLGQHR